MNHKIEELEKSIGDAFEIITKYLRENFTKFEGDFKVVKNDYFANINIHDISKNKSEHTLVIYNDVDKQEQEIKIVNEEGETDI